MELRIWNYSQDASYIPDFLEGMGLAHNEPAKDEEWFHWKFEQSPYGPAILATAFDEARVAGCVAYGLGVLQYNGKKYKCALSYETYVHPDYQGKGLFKKLITLAEAEMKNRGVDFAYNFPNSNSLPGFVRMGWNQYNDLKQYKIKISNWFKVLTHVKDLKLVFQPNPSNHSALSKEISSDVNGINKAVNNETYIPIWNSEYLKWRFLTYPNREYCIQDTDKYFCVSMVGHRGCLKVAEILYMEAKIEKSNRQVVKTVLKDLKKRIAPDIIAYSTTVSDDTVDGVCGFFNVPTHANFCYKIFNEDLKTSNFKMILPSINAHTY